MKKYLKKISALLAAMTMVMAMCVTAFAAPVTGKPLDIPVMGAGDKATYQYLQLIEPDNSQTSGWKFTNDQIAKNFTDAFGLPEGENQKAIWMLIMAKEADTDPTPTPNPQIPEGTQAASGDQVRVAITNVANAGYSLKDGKTVSSAGVYYIRPTEAGYAYNPMAAYVSFGYNEGGEPNTLVTEGVGAKRSEITTGKTSEEADKITEIGRIETYYISSVVPFIPLQDGNRNYYVVDTITGAEYVVAADGKINLNIYYGKTVEQVKAGLADGSIEGPDATGAGTVSTTTSPTTGETTGQTFTADLTSVLDGNAHANSAIVITYQATVTDTAVGNAVEIGNGDQDSIFGNSSEQLFTGKIEITKVDDSDQKQPLANAGFVISKTVQEGETKTVLYAKFNTDTNEFAGWTADETEATEVVTDTYGRVTVYGLDEGTYHITEKTAPIGYSVNGDIEDVTLEVDGTATGEFSAQREVKDTKLSALPSTGSIGTYLFTLIGVVVMATTAGIFFVKRRRNAK